jgi:type IV pilus assembly protein PilM
MMARAFPPDVIVLDTDGLLHVRVAGGKRAARIVQSKLYRLAADTFSTAVVTPELTNEASLAEALRRLRMETGRWERGSLLLPDSWFRMNLLDISSFSEGQKDALEVVRWTLKRTIPIPPESLRISYQVVSRTNNAAKLLVVSALEKTLATIERLFSDGGIEIVMIEPLGLNVWNAIAVRELATAKDRLFIYVRDREFTTAVFRGSQPLFIRSRNLSGERSVQQEIRLSANYLRDALRAEGFENCYVAGDRTGDIATMVASEFSSPVRTVTLRDFVEEMPSDTAGLEAELTACTGVFTA